MLSIFYHFGEKIYIDSSEKPRKIVGLSVYQTPIFILYKGDEKMTLQEKIQFIEDVMEVDEGTLTTDTILEDVEEWDSLSILVLTMEMKKRYNIIITTDMIKALKTVDDICQYIPD